MRTITRITAGLAVLSALSLTAACGGADTAAGAADDVSSSTPEPSSPATSDDMGGADQAMDPAADLVGPGCQAYADAVPDGAGSVAGMAADPVAVAASNNPLLTTLVAAVSGGLNPDVNLVDTLNGGEFTVFAPVDDAFAQVPARTVRALAKDADLLTSVLTYHVVPGRIAPDAIVGEHETVQGDTVMVSGSGDDLKVDDASVICGGVTTKNATVYLIDSVLMPS